MTDTKSETFEVEINHIVQDLADDAGITMESASAVEAEVTNSGDLRLTIHGEKDLHSTKHRLPEELR